MNVGVARWFGWRIELRACPAKAPENHKDDDRYWGERFIFPLTPALSQWEWGWNQLPP